MGNFIELKTTAAGLNGVQENKPHINTWVPDRENYPSHLTTTISIFLEGEPYNLWPHFLSK